MGSSTVGCFAPILQRNLIIAEKFIDDVVM